MKYSYYPGCTLRNKAKALDDYARASALALGFELEEISEWQCCGGVYPLGSDEIATKLASVRALNEAKEKGQELVTLCSACHHVIKRVNDDMKNVADIRMRANNYMGLETPYGGETTVLHFLEVLRDRIGFDKLKEKVVNPFTGKRSAHIMAACFFVRERFWNLTIQRIQRSWRILSVRSEQSRSFIRTCNECCGRLYFSEGKGDG